MMQMEDIMHEISESKPLAESRRGEQPAGLKKNELSVSGTA